MEWLIAAAVVGAATLVTGITSSVMSQKESEKNREFQQEQFDYQKQLNDTVMEREDTAFLRQASDAQKVGINPMALASGNGAASSPLQSTSFPGTHTDYSGIAGIGSSLGSLFTSIPSMMSAGAERDLLAQQADKQKLENFVYAHENGIVQDSKGNWVFESPETTPHYKRALENLDERLKTAEASEHEASASRSWRVDDYQAQSGTTDVSHPNIRFGSELLSNKNLGSLVKVFGKQVLGLNDGSVRSNILARMYQYLNPERTETSKVIDKTVPKFNSKKASKNIKNNQAKYYNRMVRNLYEKGNSN